MRDYLAPQRLVWGGATARKSANRSPAGHPKEQDATVGLLMIRSVSVFFLLLFATAAAMSQEGPMLGLVHREVADKLGLFMEMVYDEASDDRFQGGKAHILYGVKEGVVAVLEYELDDGIHRGRWAIFGKVITSISIIGVPMKDGVWSNYRASKLGSAMVSAMQVVGCEEAIDNFSWALERVANGIVASYSEACRGYYAGFESDDRSTIFPQYTISLTEDRTVWVFTIEPREVCCTDSSSSRMILNMVNENDPVLDIDYVR